jgi:U3 small nucleolar ribonucleoprotein component
MIGIRFSSYVKHSQQVSILLYKLIVYTILTNMLKKKKGWKYLAIFYMWKSEVFTMSTTKSGQSLREEFDGRYQKLSDEGLVDFKAEVDVNNHSSPYDLVRVYNNVLRLREENKFKRIFTIGWKS